MLLTLEMAFESYMQYLEDRNLSETYLDTVYHRLRKFVFVSKGCPIDRRNWDVKTIGRRDLQKHFDSLEATGLAGGTLAGHSTTHRAFWKWALRSGRIDKSPFIGIKSYSYKPRIRRAAPEEHVQKVADVLQDFAYHRSCDGSPHPRDVRDALIVSLVLDNGGRIGEIASLKRSDLLDALNHGRRTPNGRVVYRIIGNGKTGDQALRFFAETADFAQIWLDVSPWPKAYYICINLRTGSRMVTNTISRAFPRICKFADVPEFRPHSVRKRNVTDMIRMSGNPKAGQVYANHLSAATTMQHYDDVDQEWIDDLAAELADRRRGKPGYDPGIARFFGLLPDSGEDPEPSSVS